MGILFGVLAGPIIVSWLYHKLVAKYPSISIFTNRFCGSLMILCVAQFFFSNIGNSGRRPSGFFWLTMLIPLSFLLQRKIWRTLGLLFKSGGLRMLGCCLVCVNLAAYIYKYASDHPALFSSIGVFSAVVIAAALIYELLFAVFLNDKFKYPTPSFLILVNVIGIYAIMA